MTSSQPASEDSAQQRRKAETDLNVTVKLAQSFLKVYIGEANGAVFWVLRMCGDVPNVDQQRFKRLYTEARLEWHTLTTLSTHTAFPMPLSSLHSRNTANSHNYSVDTIATS